jgi:acetylornithine deacetylase
MGVKTVVEILLDLVAIPSVSSLSNRPMIDYALPYLDGWNIDLYPFLDPAGIEKVNLVARSHTLRAVELSLVCHTDTVPFAPDWKEALAPAIRNGRLYGRGSGDVKGFLACILAAMSNVDRKRLKKPLAVILTADEEVGCVGAKLLARRKVIRSRYTIVGEPTSLHPVRAGKGYALAEIVVHGKEAHSAFPERGRSAIYEAARVIAKLERVAKKLAARRNQDFDPPYTTLNVGLIQGGTAKNIVPGECRLTVEWRPIPGQDPALPARLIREALRGRNAHLDIRRLDPPFDPATTHDLATLLESLSRRPSTTVAFGTEAAHMHSSETVVFGPGDMTVAHKTGEFVPISQLKACVRHLTAVINRLCGSTQPSRHESRTSHAPRRPAA